MDIDQKDSKSPAIRTKLNVPLSFRRRYSRNDEDGILKNISQTGAFLSQKGEPLEMGTRVHLFLEFLGLQRELICEVVWNRSTPSVNGSGIRFIPNAGRDKQAVHDFIEFINEQKSSRYEVLDMIFKKVA